MMKRESLSLKIKNIRITRYRLRLLMALFVVATLAIGVIDVAVFQGLSGQIQRDVEKEIGEMLENTAGSYENQVIQYQDQAQILYQNQDVRAYLVSQGREDSHIDSIYASMKAMAGNMTGISSVILFHKDKILASYDTGMVLKEAKEEIVEKISDTASDKEFFFVWTDKKKSRRQMVVFWSDREYLYGPSSYGVALVISLDAVQNRVIPWKQKTENPVYIFYEDGELVAAQEAGHDEAMKAVFQKIMEQGQESGMNYEVLDENRRTVFHAIPKNGRFIALRVQEHPSSQKEVNQALRTILLSTILGMGLMAAIVWVLSGWMYRPLGKIFRNILELAHAPEDGNKAELMLVTDALEDVNANMILLRKQIRHNAVVRFLRQGSKGGEIDRNIFELPEQIPVRFDMLVFRYDMDTWERNDALISEIGDWLGGAICYRMGQGEISVLLWDKGFTEAKAEELLARLEKSYGIRGCVGIASSGSLEELPAAYRTAEQLTEYHILSKEIRVIPQHILNEKKQGGVQEPEKERILKFVKEDAEEDIGESIHRLLQNLTDYRIKEAQDYLKKLIADVIRLSENIGGENQVQYEIYLEDFLTNQIFIGQVDIEEWLCELFNQVKTQLKAGRQTNAFRIMMDVEHYIEENYMDSGLSVETVAERYGLSISYFSKVFNQYTGKTFPDYTNCLRLEKAREMLLADQHKPIGEIANQVGFSSSSYFSAAFRKYYGVSPSQVRKKN